MTIIERLPEILAAHSRWLRGEDGGVRADLVGADLRNADLGGANLRNADLFGAHLYRADLGNADLFGAHLYRADLRSADLGGADLGDATVFQVGPLGSRSDYLVYSAGIQDGQPWEQVQAGCWSGSLDALAERVATVYHVGHPHRVEYDAAIACIRAVLSVRPKTS